MTLSSFENDYRYNTHQATRTNSLSVGLQQLGAFVACFLAWPMTDYLGRKKSLMIASFVFCIGAAIQTINTHSLAAFYVARVIAGLGLGCATVIVPTASLQPGLRLNDIGVLIKCSVQQRDGSEGYSWPYWFFLPVVLYLCKPLLFPISLNSI